MILVTGATGMFGSRVARQARARGAQVRVLVRDRAKAEGLAEAGIELAVGDLDRPETVAAALAGVERAFLVTPMDERIAARETAFVAAAREAGVRHVVKLYGAVRHRGDALDALHRQGIDALRSSGLEWTLLSPQTVMETNFLGQAGAIAATGAMWGCAGEGRAAFVAADDCGRAGAVVLTTDGHAGREYAITGPEALSLAEVAERMTAAFGRPLAYNDLPEDDFAGLLTQQGMTREQAEMGVILHMRAFRRGDANLVTGDYAALTGEAPVTVEQWLGENAERFAG